MDYNLPDSSVHEIFQARIMEWVAIYFSNILDTNLSAFCKDFVIISALSFHFFLTMSLGIKALTFMKSSLLLLLWLMQLLS